MEAPSPGHRGEARQILNQPLAQGDLQQRRSALKTSAPPSPRRQLPEAGVRVNWRSPTPIREEAPPTVTSQPNGLDLAAALASQAVSQPRRGARSWKKQTWRPWSNQQGQKGKSKGKAKSGKKGKAKGQTKSK